MNRDAAHYRQRAEECRQLATTARGLPTIEYLLMMADEFDDEATMLETESGPTFD